MNDMQFISNMQKPKYASQGSLRYMRDLAASRDSEAAVANLPEAWQTCYNAIVEGLDNVAQSDVSKFIDLLKTCDKISMSTKAPIPGSAMAGNPPVEDGIYHRKNRSGQDQFFKVYWNLDKSRLLAKEIVLIQEAYTVQFVWGVEHHPAMSELQYRGAAFRYVTANDLYKPSLEEAIAFGPKYGRCGLCGRELNNELSVELGIGPVCGDRDFGGEFKVMKKMAKAKLAEQGTK